MRDGGTSKTTRPHNRNAADASKAAEFERGMSALTEMRYGITPDQRGGLHLNAFDFIDTLFSQTLQTTMNARVLLGLELDGKPGAHWADDMMVVIRLRSKLKERFTKESSPDARVGLMLMSAIGKVVMPLLLIRDRQRKKGSHPYAERIARHVIMARMVATELDRNGGKKTQAYKAVAQALNVAESAVRDAWGAKDRGRR